MPISEPTFHSFAIKALLAQSIQTKRIKMPFMQSLRNGVGVLKMLIELYLLIVGKYPMRTDYLFQELKA
jgi:hypothetical protein